jgi:hypothetical protein
MYSRLHIALVRVFIFTVACVLNDLFIIPFDYEKNIVTDYNEEGWTFTQAAYFTSVSVTTVGYGNIIIVRVDLQCILNTTYYLPILINNISIGLVNLCDHLSR